MPTLINFAECDICIDDWQASFGQLRAALIEFQGEQADEWKYWRSKHEEVVTEVNQLKTEVAGLRGDLYGCLRSFSVQSPQQSQEDTMIELAESFRRAKKELANSTLAWRAELDEVIARLDALHRAVKPECAEIESIVTTHEVASEEGCGTLWGTWSTAHPSSEQRRGVTLQKILPPRKVEPFSTALGVLESEWPTIEPEPDASSLCPYSAMAVFHASGKMSMAERSSGAFGDGAFAESRRQCRRLLITESSAENET
eukprot:CAMPEP_0169185356 /NCGR_PEP_ID=MMETSP1016-20121227/1746_1 /TAXON_ID=342587 /ORGANISM="Karlodinium micrum, Strain CCMP2283" /LENGTH=256 /DNA_ID=CAMNT_0009261041 /DNA_START=31 /DNA_END=797 /DNA_ORIENTATION=-